MEIPTQFHLMVIVTGRSSYPSRSGRMLHLHSPQCSFSQGVSESLDDWISKADGQAVHAAVRKIV